jgi:FtsP/CotA-like multicopper oxidase with cupredoxin domain
MISETKKTGINNEPFLFSKNLMCKILSISLALFIISNIFTASTVALATSSSSSSTTATSNTISGATVNNSNNMEKQQSQPPPLQQPKTHKYTLIAKETTLQIAPSVRVDAWTYNDTIPGPTLTATEGDRVIIHFINKTPFHIQFIYMETILANKTVYLNKYRQMEHTLMMSLQNQPVH